MSTLDCVPKDNGLDPAKPIKYSAMIKGLCVLGQEMERKTITSYSAVGRKSKPIHQTLGRLNTSHHTFHVG